jgi:hypothetical protein
MRDFPWGATRSFKPLHKICDFDLMFDAARREIRQADGWIDTGMALSP